MREPEEVSVNYTPGEVQALIAPLVGLKEPTDIQNAIIFVWSGDTMRVACGVSEEDSFRTLVHRLMHDLIDMT